MMFGLDTIIMNCLKCISKMQLILKLIISRKLTWMRLDIWIATYASLRPKILGGLVMLIPREYHKGRRF